MLFDTQDFTLSTYSHLLTTLQRAGYNFLTVEEYAKRVACEEGGGALIAVLRHDVDKHPERSLQMAELEHSLGIRATYYFRVLPCSYDELIIKQIAALGHEVGYHYEDLSLAGGDQVKAAALFDEHLAQLRRLVPVCTICMHGAPMSRYDGRTMWQQTSYRSRGIIAEPYLDFDYSRLGYLTDTGRCWDGDRYSLRDRVGENVQNGCDSLTTQVANEKHDVPIKILRLHSTKDICKAAENGKLPKQIMLTTHPQRWAGTWSVWLHELLMQSIKNPIKHLLLIFRKYT